MPRRRRKPPRTVWLKEQIEARLPMPAVILAHALHGHFAGHRRRQTALLQQLGAPTCVMRGPFTEMKYIGTAAGSALLPKLLGTYEQELHQSISALLTRQPDLLIDIGAAEGYYAVGMARALPQLQIVAFDTNRYARHLLRKLADRNCVASRIQIRGLCTARDLETVLEMAHRPAIICDCEGAEIELLDPESVPALRRTMVLVELHDMVRPGLSALIRARFTSTHTIAVMTARAREETDFPLDLPLSREDKQSAMYEFRGRGRQDWFFMRPHQQVE